MSTDDTCERSHVHLRARATLCAVNLIVSPREMHLERRLTMMHEATKLATSRHLYAYINRHSTASLLTAATLAYATGAGITAAAGTRLALQ